MDLEHQLRRVEMDWNKVSLRVAFIPKQLQLSFGITQARFPAARVAARPLVTCPTGSAQTSPIAWHYPEVEKLSEARFPIMLVTKMSLVHSRAVIAYA